jgi:hypothetical protein
LARATGSQLGAVKYVTHVGGTLGYNGLAANKRERTMRKGHTKATPKAKKQTTHPPDKLIKTTKKGDVELTEKELDRVAGGILKVLGKVEP